MKAYVIKNTADNTFKGQKDNYVENLVSAKFYVRQKTAEKQIESGHWAGGYGVNRSLLKVIEVEITENA